MKRVDFFVSEREIDRLCKAIRQAGAPGYSVMRHVTGWGLAGEISEAMDFSGLGANAHVVVFCEASAVEALRETVRPLLERRGLLEEALFARRVGWPDQVVAPAAALAAGEMPYFSLLLIRQGWPVVLP